MPTRRTVLGRLTATAGLAAAPGLPLLLTACASPPAPTFRPVRFTGERPVRFSVAAIEIVEAEGIVPPRTAAPVPVPPATALRTWADDRLRAVGPGDGRLRVTITEATAVADPLPRTPGVRGAFTTDQTERFTVRVATRLDVLSLDGRTLASLSGKAERFSTAAEDMTLNDRSRIWHELVIASTAELDQTLTAAMPRDLGRWIAL